VCGQSSAPDNAVSPMSSRCASADRSITIRSRRSGAVAARSVDTASVTDGLYIFVVTATRAFHAAAVRSCEPLLRCSFCSRSRGNSRVVSGTHKLLEGPASGGGKTNLVGYNGSTENARKVNGR